jgi:hypothetical protein
VALDNRLWIFFDAIFKRRSVVSVLASRFSRYVPLLDVMNRRPRYPERARTILVIGDRRHSAQALPKKQDFVSPTLQLFITVQRSYSANQPHFKPQFDHSCLG